MNSCTQFHENPTNILVPDIRSQMGSWTISFIMSVCLSIHVEQLCYLWMDIHEIFYLSIL